ncbi:MAG: alpha/beta hydrolase [Alphaproteobacteria bacterium]|nr:alpha/beta hydrolase [Alphaproteobacteria bacterium]
MALPETLYLTVDGVKLEVRKYAGADNAPTLVFLHEGLGCVGMWRDFPAKLSRATGCPALVYSRQGYGRSRACPLPRPLNYMHDEAVVVLPRLLKAAGTNDHILIGHSDGGSIALIYAGERYRAGLRGVITMAPHIFCEQISVTAIRQARRDFLAGNLRSSLAKYHLHNVDCAFWGWNNVWLDPDFRQWNIEEFLPEISVPQLVLQGKEDPYGTKKQLAGIAEQSGGAVSVQLLENCGHAPYREQADQSLALMQEFLRTVM